MNIGFADDVTQVAQDFNNDKHKLTEDTITEIKKLNIYERKWKIQTNLTKFNIRSIFKTRPMPINVEGRPIPFSNEVKTLGLTLKRTGTIAHLNNGIKLAEMQTNKLIRFNKIREKNKLHQYKVLVRQILEYPTTPILWHQGKIR